MSKIISITDFTLNRVTIGIDSNGFKETLSPNF